MNSLVVFLVIAVFVVVIYLSAFPRWKCTELGCERAILGDFSSLGECKSNCNPVIPIWPTKTVNVIYPQVQPVYYPGNYHPYRFDRFDRRFPSRFRR